MRRVSIQSESISRIVLARLLLSEREQIPFAEERRVFYVAVTRARRRVLILAPEKGASVFLQDLPDSARVKTCDDIQNAAPCPKCKKGRLVLRMGTSAFYGCTNLTKVIFEGIVPPYFASVENTPGVFDDNATNRKIYVPAIAINNYKEALPEYADDIEAIDDSESEI